MCVCNLATSLLFCNTNTSSDGYGTEITEQNSNLLGFKHYKLVVTSIHMQCINIINVSSMHVFQC